MRWIRLALILRHRVDRSAMVAPEYCALIRSSRVNDASAKPMQMTAKARMTSRLIRVRSSNVLILALAV